MVVRGWLINGVIIYIASLVSSEVQELYHQENAAVPPSICSGDLSFTKGYRCVDYNVITEDGYILRLWRFHEGRTKESRKERKQPVFMQHGVFTDGRCWFAVSHADQSLAIQLVEQGYDVWIPNTRGTTYSQQHVSSNITYSSGYWDFTYSEMATYDLRAFLNFVYLETGQKVHYIGHSQGTTMMFAAFSEWKVEERVKSAVMLAPVVFLNHMPFGLTYALAKSYIGEIAGTFGIWDLNIMIEPIGTIIRAICNVLGVDCFNQVFSLLSGKNCCMNSSTIQLWLSFQLQPTSIKNLEHWAQGVRKPIFAQYDYGNPATNMEHYGVPEPPPYDLRKIPKDFPLFLIYGGQDLLSIREDVHILLNKLRSHRIVRELYIDNYAHFDFLQGITAKDVVFPDIVGFMQGID
ncbi:hypothetical protein DCAR_0104894 [Daucus carota subsp. sativus]|uniref:Lipase n=1 Tax=Daucus carota subsp. sativus TaxID=79200 RepID=A0AAF0WCQ9_DAUCS|nr:hypothetical protein DCAR_0104894 [Daucus carota subsp. sativus]